MYAPGSPGHREIRVLKDRVLELLAETVGMPERAAERAMHDATAGESVAPFAAAGAPSSAPPADF